MAALRWARLTWQAADPVALAADLGRRLGVAPGPHPGIAGAFLLALGDADLELVPWRPETGGDRPRAAGRLVLEPVEGGTDAPASAGAGVVSLAAVGWATVELDRAEAELAPWLALRDGPDRPAVGPDAVDPLLGARVRVRATAGLPGPHLVLAEPSTEGRLAASLARDGEGPCALYLRPAAGVDAWRAAARSRGVPVTRVEAGPFGREVLVPGDAMAGPHVIVAEAPVPLSATTPASTIGP